MARINFEDSIYQDNRFIKLCMQMGGKYQALGALVCAWSLAQKWYKTPEKLIPISEWKKQEIPFDIIDVGLAEVTSDGEKVRVKGADEQFAWLVQRQNAGKSGGLKLKENLASGRKRSSGGAKPPSLTLTLTPSPTQSPSQNTKSARSKLSVSSRAELVFSEISETIESRGVSTELQKSWLAAFPDVPWIISEVRKALAWEAANPKRRKIDFGKFITSWMSRGWDARRIEPEKKTINWDKVFKE